MSGREVLLDDPDLWRDEEGVMRFRLTYQGPLPSTQGAPRGAQADPRAHSKHLMRKQFHKQLKRLWEVNLNLSNPAGREVIPLLRMLERPSPEALARTYSMFGWHFVPLVTDQLSVTCGLDVLLLRPTPAHKDSWFGDVDNRLKTLIDALQVPSPNERYGERQPEPGEEAFYCLMANDKMLSRVAAETDEMLEPVGDRLNDGDVRLVITVEVKPIHIHMVNLPFA